MPLDECNDNQFTLVQSKRRHKNKKNHKNRKLIGNLNNNTTTTSIDLPSAVKRINETELDIVSSEFYKHSLNQLKSIKSSSGNGLPFKQIICFGIGHISTCSIARHQLAYILAIRKEFNIEIIEFHEPALTPTEKSILIELNCTIHSSNIEGKCLIETESTILFLPHCPKQLTNNLLWRNWSAINLPNISALIGNSFESIIQSTPQRFLQQDAEYLLKIFPYTNEIKLANNFLFTDIFNDLSIHRFEVDRVTPSFWTTENSEPKYVDCIELIGNLQI